MPAAMATWRPRTTVWRLRVEPSLERQAALILIGVCLLSPYMHLYDLTVLVAGGLILMRDERSSLAKFAVIIAWILPMTLGWLAVAGLPIAPLLVLFVFAVACMPGRPEAAVGSERSA